VIGYLKLNLADAQTELKRENSIEIERIYILKDYHGKKVAQLLFETALTIANERNASFIWLGVWEHNPRAIHFYKKYSFVEFDKHIFRLGNDDQTDIMMKLIL
jgi:ribosomal protein S18 acetylase RimI-like enzyme